MREACGDSRLQPAFDNPGRCFCIKLGLHQTDVAAASSPLQDVGDQVVALEPAHDGQELGIHQRLSAVFLADGTVRIRSLILLEDRLPGNEALSATLAQSLDRSGWPGTPPPLTASARETRSQSG